MTEKIIVFFGCSMRGGQKKVSRRTLAKIPAIIESLGLELASKHQTQKGILDKENMLTPHEIHDRDYGWEELANLGFFEVSNASFGAGGEISDMIHLKKPVLCFYRLKWGWFWWLYKRLFKAMPDKEISAYIRGKQGSRYVKTPFECHGYTTLKDLKRIMQNFVSSCPLKMILA